MIRRLRNLLSDTSGVAMTELALSTPLVLMAGLWGMETANYAIVQMKVSQTALHVADNMARVGESTVLTNRKLYENDINDVLAGAFLQTGQDLDVFNHGRIIVSSVEVFDTDVHCLKSGCPVTSATDGDYFVAWQRCRGSKNHVSSYGLENGKLDGGMGPMGAKVVSNDDDATIFVEISYTYQPVFTDEFLATNEISAIASYTVRHERDRTELYTRTDFGSPTKSDCSVFNP
ncbi:TadE/TadG family type IV pilus assembly protein [Parerythrobacter jejuensis]|uniref:Pilus assembly protein n=1 Tax=Parerythrobacter jejuensis TaxID=795812 RepID=A0A845AQ35_9SPHN|nr:pilus assembly protein [Parerythrobacter jejuensis]MXP32410.1 pilus assembly protein [Parerythrobacter jejuensis]